MAFRRLEFPTLAELDGGRLREAFDQALARLHSDLEDRPGLASARRLTLQLELKPVCDETGKLDSVDIGFQLDERIPRRKSKTYNARHDGRGLYVSVHAPEDARQGTIDELLGEVSDAG